jgi:hypothetical protein
MFIIESRQMKTLSEIALRDAQPWTGCYLAPTAAELEGWYQRYEQQTDILIPEILKALFGDLRR